MDIKDLALLNVTKNIKALKAFSKKTATVFATKHSCALWGGFLNAEIKYFHITDTTKDRIRNVPVNEITGSKLIDLKNKPASGVVFFNDGLHFLYHIRRNGVYIMTSSHKSRKTYADTGFAASQLMSGFLYFDFFSDTANNYINNIVDALGKDDHALLHDASTKHLMRAIKKEHDLGKNDIYSKHVEDFNVKYEHTKLCLQAFMFIHFAKVIDSTRVSQENDTRTLAERLRKKPVSTVDIIRVDTFYDETMKVINPFSVSGHYRNQPCGVGRKETKLIYIDSFMKTGYTRIATKEKLGMNDHQPQADPIL